MHIDFIIIGQGISGTFLHWYLHSMGASCTVIDENKPNTASRVAAGLINPVTGRRLVKSWLIEELMPFAWQAYKNIGSSVQIDCIREMSLLQFFQAPDMQDAFNKKLNEEPDYLAACNDDSWREHFNYPFGCGIINPCYIADAAGLVAAYARKFPPAHEQFDATQLIISADHVRYKDFVAKKIVFCDGPAGLHNPWFGRLPYSLNKGEALIVKIPGLNADHSYKFGHTLIPINGKESIFWFGSSNEWTYADDLPSEKFRKHAEAELKHALKLPYAILDHRAATRPANVERRPFVGLHPVHPQLGILNGLGTKGCSLAPYFAHQLAAHLVQNKPLLPAVDVQRFNRVLSK
jgi:glycine/D-amino acid oxidase-like deaminating enzyme